MSNIVYPVFTTYRIKTFQQGAKVNMCMYIPHLVAISNKGLRICTLVHSVGKATGCATLFQVHWGKHCILHNVH